MKKNCKYCGKEFEGRANQLFCNAKCKDAYLYQQRKSIGNAYPFGYSAESQDKTAENSVETAENSVETAESSVNRAENSVKSSGFGAEPLKNMSTQPPQPVTMSEDWYTELLDTNLRASEKEIALNKRIAELESENKYNQKYTGDLKRHNEDLEYKIGMYGDVEKENAQLAEQNKRLTEQVERLQAQQREAANARLQAQQREAALKARAQAEEEEEYGGFSIGFSD